MQETSDDLAIPFSTVAELLARHAREHPEKTAIADLDGGRKIDFAGLRRAVERIAAWLEDTGVGRGDKVVVLADERIEKLLVFLAVWRVGAIACPFHVEMSVEHLRAIVTYIEPRLVLWHADLDGDEIVGGLGYPSMRFSSWPDGGPEPGELFASVRSRNGGGAPRGTNFATDTACIFSTSGTTDRPKCVEWDHLGLWLCGLSSLDFTGMTGEDRLLEYRTFSWLSPQILALMPFLQTGLTLHMARRFSHGRFFDWIAENRITVAIGVPTVINMLLNRPVDIEPDRIDSLRLMTSSSAPLSPDRWRKFEETYGIALLQFYGASEGGWLCGNRHDDRKLGTVGRPARHMEFAILDPDGGPCPSGVEGEIAIRGAQTAVAAIAPTGEYQDMRPTRLTEWFRTGDIGFADEGRLRYRHRAGQGPHHPRRRQYRAARNRRRADAPARGRGGGRRGRSRSDLRRGDRRLRRPREGRVDGPGERDFGLRPPFAGLQAAQVGVLHRHAAQVGPRQDPARGAEGDMAGTRRCRARRIVSGGKRTGTRRGKSHNMANVPV